MAAHRSTAPSRRAVRHRRFRTKGPTPSPPGPADDPRAAPQPARSVTLGTAACGSIEGQPCEFPCGQRGVHLLLVRRSAVHAAVGRGVDTVATSLRARDPPAPPTRSASTTLYGVRRERRRRPARGSVVVMITSLDGSTVVDGRSGGLGNATDSSILGALRRAADVVLVGAGTATAEHYGPPDQRRPAHRRGDRAGEHRPRIRAVHERRRLPGAARGRPTEPARDRRRAGRPAAASTSRPPWPASAPSSTSRRSCWRRAGPASTPRCSPVTASTSSTSRSSPAAGGRRRRPHRGRRRAPTFDRYDLVHLATEDGYLYGRWVRRRF